LIGGIFHISTGNFYLEIFSNPAGNTDIISSYGSASDITADGPELKKYISTRSPSYSLTAKKI
jgi:hypothetical protein